MRARFRLEDGLMTGGALALIRAAIGGWTVVDWIKRGLGALAQQRLALVAATLIIVGIRADGSGAGE